MIKKEQEFLIKYFSAFNPGHPTMKAMWLLNAILLGYKVRFVGSLDFVLIYIFNQLGVTVDESNDSSVPFCFEPDEINFKNLKSLGHHSADLENLKKWFTKSCALTTTPTYYKLTGLMFLDEYIKFNKLTFFAKVLESNKSSTL